MIVGVKLKKQSLNHDNEKVFQSFEVKYPKLWKQKFKVFDLSAQSAISPLPSFLKRLFKMCHTKSSRMRSWNAANFKLGEQPLTEFLPNFLPTLC